LGNSLNDKKSTKATGGAAPVTKLAISTIKPKPTVNLNPLANGSIPHQQQPQQQQQMNSFKVSQPQQQPQQQQQQQQPQQQFQQFQPIDNNSSTFQFQPQPNNNGVPNFTSQGTFTPPQQQQQQHNFVPTSGGSFVNNM